MKGFETAWVTPFFLTLTSGKKDYPAMKGFETNAEENIPHDEYVV